MVGTSANPSAWKITGFYGHPEVAKRKEAWSLLKHLSFFHPKAWVCVGDFNEILSDTEKFGVSKTPRRQMQDFQDSIGACQLFDLGFSGPKNTWNNKREDLNFIQERLDRAMANSEWIDQLPGNRVEVLAACNSDHLPLLLLLEEKQTRSPLRKQVFRYEAGWGEKNGE